MECTSIYATSLVLPGNQNIHVEWTTHWTSTSHKLLDMLAAHSLVQHCIVPPHHLEHILDPIIMHADLPVQVLPVNPPLLSYHVIVIMDIDCLSIHQTERTACSYHLFA